MLVGSVNESLYDINSLDRAAAIGAQFNGSEFHFETIVLGFLVGLFSLRLDIATMYHEAAQFIETKLDQAHSYYSALQFGEAPKLYRRKNEPSAIRMLYAVFAYPAVMNIITVLLLIDMFLPPFNLIGYRISLIYIFLVSYGILVSLRSGNWQKKEKSNASISRCLTC